MISESFDGIAVVVEGLVLLLCSIDLARVVNMQGGTISGGQSGLFHNRNFSFFVRHYVWRLGSWYLFTSGSSVFGFEREEVWKAGEILVRNHLFQRRS